jgi:hypothetical protein
MIFGLRDAPAGFLCSKCEWTCSLESLSSPLCCGSPEKLIAHSRLRVHDDPEPTITLL